MSICDPNWSGDMYVIEYCAPAAFLTGGRGDLWVHFDEADNLYDAKEIEASCRAAHPKARIRMRHMQVRADIYG
jgi:hypothetical protein